MNRQVQVWALGAVALAALVAGCEKGPKLSKQQAILLIQAQYDQQPPVPAIILVKDAGMKDGVLAHYWDRTKAYPNHVWADFKLTDVGKKAVKLPDGGDTILWHPDSATDTRYAIELSPLVVNHLKAEAADSTGPTKSATGMESMVYEEVTSLAGAPDPVQEIARDSQARLASPRTAVFVLDNGSWKLQSIQ